MNPTELIDNIQQQGYCVIDDFLAATDYQALQQTIQEKLQEQAFKPAGIGHKHNQNKDIRTDSLLWLDKETSNNAMHAYFNQLDQLLLLLNQTLYLGLVDYEAHFAVYEPHQFYKKHIDQFAHQKERRISSVYYLNESWKKEFGGALQLYDRNDQKLTNIMPIGNRFVFFESDLPHEVSTAYQRRYSIAAWLKVRPFASFR